MTQTRRTRANTRTQADILVAERNGAAVVIPAPGDDARFRDLIEATTDYIWEVDDQLRFTYVSPHAQQVLGYAPKDMLGKTPFDFMAPQDVSGLEAKVAQIVAQRAKLSLVQHPRATKDGRRIFIEIAGVPMFDRDGHFAGYRGISRDISERMLMVERVESRDAILRAVSQAVALLLTSPVFAKGMTKALQLIGESINVDRVLVIEYAQPPAPNKPMMLSYDWQAPDVPVHVDAAYFHRKAATAPRSLEWYTPLIRNEPVTDSIYTAREPAATIMRELHIKSILLLPIHVDGIRWGNLTIDVCKTERVWTNAEIDALRTLANVIGASIMRERHIAELAAANKIVNSSTTMLFRVAATPPFPLTFITGNVSYFDVTADALLADPTLYQRLVHPDDQPKIAAILAALTNEGGPGERIEFRYRKKNRYDWAEARFNPIRGNDGPAEVEGIITDITERKRVEERIVHMARHDVLTGLLNRQEFADAVRTSIAHARRGGGHCAIHYLDLDRFKDVNDTLGHPVGDRLLQAIASRLKSLVRETDLVARFGGDEFAVLQTDIKEPTDAGTLATKLIGAMDQPYNIDGNSIQIGTSIGVALCDPTAANAESLLSHADVALYRAKAEGRGTYKFFTDKMDSDVHRRVALAADLRIALANDELFLVYQPQIEVVTGRIIGLEALVRWHHPRHGMLPPPDFIEAAERSGLIGALGQWVLREACLQMRRWMDAGIAPVKMAVNVSPLQFKAPLELERSVAATLDETGVPPTVIELELTESALMETSREHNDVLERLRARGVKLAIDDFGTGYSSLSYLRRFPVDLVKIAQDFVRDVATDLNDAAIVKAAIGLARDLNLDVIAEGVETAEQLARLQSWGCNAVQGYYFCKPGAPDVIEEWLRHGITTPSPPAPAKVG